MKLSIQRTIAKIRLLKNWHKFILPSKIKSFPGKVLVVLRNGQSLWLRNGSIDLMIVFHVWLDHIYGSYENISADQPYFVLDIGAHVGTEALFISSKVPQAKIFSFEPDPENLELLQKNIQLNNLQENVVMYDKAVGKAGGKLELFVNPTNSSMNNVYTQNKKRGMENSITVETVSLAQVLEMTQVKRFDMAKIDCEGAEYDILLNASDETLAALPHMAIEWHTYDNHQPEELVEFLESKKYVVTWSRKPRMIYAHKD